ncbi:hypothetical protein L0F63_000077 [Massospora cicadina]|nr:hypothetical protein L0F63_000077 [Massospora cicadina]
MIGQLEIQIKIGVGLGVAYMLMEIRPIRKKEMKYLGLGLKTVIDGRNTGVDMEAQLRTPPSSNGGSRVTSVYSANDTPRVPNFMLHPTREGSTRPGGYSEFDSGFRSYNRQPPSRLNTPTQVQPQDPIRLHPSHYNFQESLPYRKKRNNSCCCCHTRMGALCCAVFMVMFILGFALAVFFLWPRYLHPIQSSDFAQLFEATPANALQANVQINLLVTNPNYINLVVDALKVTGTLRAANLNLDKFLSGKISDAISLRAQTKSPFNIPIQLTFPNDPNALVELAQVCVNQQEVSIHYTINLSLALLSWTGYVPTISDTFAFPCPWNIPNLT